MKKIISLLTAVLTMLSFSGSCILTSAAENKVTGTDFTESAETINNPGAGYTSPLWYVCRPGDTPVKNPSGDLVVLFIDIGAFSSGANGVTDEKTGEYTEGKDYDLDKSFFEGLRGTLENCRRNGSMAGLRFRYDANGKNNPEPASFEKVLEHISQIDKNGVLRDYEDILVYVESGFVGAWGEQHSGKYTSVDYKARLLDAVLEIVPESVCVSVRTPDTFCRWAGIKTDELAEYKAEAGTDAARVGIYNDGYMGSDSDLGTFLNPGRKDAVKWMKKQMLHTVYGGEFSGNTDYAKKYDTYLPENAIPEMYDTHLSYINSNIWPLYKDMKFGPEYDISGADNSAYYGETVYKFIRDHLGYRFVLRNSVITAEAEQGGMITAALKIENTGFAGVIKKQRTEVILEKDGEYMTALSDTDDRNWLSASVSEEKLEIKLPGNIPSGKWNVYIRLSAGESDMKNASQRTVKFANSGVYNSSLGANLIGSVMIKETDDQKLKSDHSFYEKGADSVSDGTLHSYVGNVNADGKNGPYEWPDSRLAASNENSRMYIASDSEYLYVCAEVPDTASAPVYNLKLRAADGGKEYWIYYAGNGFVYFNGESYNGVTCRFSGGTVEWKIPLDDTMELEIGKELDFIRVFVQDSADEWKLIDELRTGKYTVGSDRSGDINSDGKTDSADVLAFQKYFLGCFDVTAENLLTADLNGNGRTDIADFNLLKNALVTK